MVSIGVLEIRTGLATEIRWCVTTHPTKEKIRGHGAAVPLKRGTRLSSRAGRVKSGVDDDFKSGVVQHSFFYGPIR